LLVCAAGIGLLGSDWPAGVAMLAGEVQLKPAAPPPCVPPGV